MNPFRIACAAITLACAQGAVAQEPADDMALPAPVAEAIDGHFLAYQERAHVPGLVWGVVHDGQLVHVGLSGVQDLETETPVNRDSLFRIASMSKAFTALAILKLRDDGLISLDALAETYVPELANWQYPTTDSPRIRVRDLLSHVGGLVTDNPWGDRQQSLSEEAFTTMLEEGVPFSRAPQTAFEYSNFGYALLGRIITNVSGQPYDQYIRNEIMLPLGMGSTGFEVTDAPLAQRALGYRWENEAFSPAAVQPHGVFGAMGGIQTSMNDYARWVSFLLSAWPARDGHELGPVRRSSVRELAHGLNFPRSFTVPRQESDDPCKVPFTYAMGFSVGEDCDFGRMMSHSGGYPGFGSDLMLLPDSGFAIFAFANRTYAAPRGAVRSAGLELAAANLVSGREFAVTDALASAYAIAGAMFEASSIEPGRDMLAMNFLLDRSAENWALELTSLAEQSGSCATDGPLTALGALHGEFHWTCERGTMQGRVLLSPTNPPAIQGLRLRVTPTE